jgi:PAS domain S-box-containing protein
VSLVAAEGPASRHVLDLPGEGSYVELPARLFTNEVVTVEGWVKWRSLGLYSRFFQFADASLQIALMNVASSSTVRFERYRGPAFDDLKVADVPNMIRSGEWQHLAVVTGTNWSRLYVNGILIRTSEQSLNFRPNPLPPLQNFLGRSVMKGNPEASRDTELDGQIAEVRLWAGERSDADIRSNLYRQLSGREPGLLALWNFGDGTANDASPNGRHGKLVGNARVVEAPGPSPEQVRSIVLLAGQVFDPGNQPVPRTTVRLERDGVELARVDADSRGHYELALAADGKGYDLEAVSGTNDDWRVAIQLSAASGQPQPLDFHLAESLSASGTVFSLDTNSPLANVVVELARVPFASPPSANSDAGATNLAVNATITDAKGKFSFDGLRPGTYRLRCHLLGEYADLGRSVAVSRDAAARAANSSLDFSLAPFKKGTWRMLGFPDGLKSLRIFSLKFDAQGVLWMGTFAGAARFDGQELSTLTSEDGLADDLVTSIESGTNGIMWFGTTKGLSRYDPNAGTHKFVNFTSADGLLTNFVWSLQSEPGGALWVGTDAGLSRFDGTNWIHFAATNAFPLAQVRALAMTPDGSLWVGGLRQTSTCLVRVRGTNVMTFGPTEGLNLFVVLSLCLEPNGNLWLGGVGPTSSLFRFDGTTFRPITGTSDFPSLGQIPAVRQAPGGSVWLTSDAGLVCYDGRRLVIYGKEDSAALGSAAYALAIAPDGAIWTGTFGNGVVRYDAESFANYGSADGLRSKVSEVVGLVDGNLAVGTDLGVYIFDGRVLTNYTEESGWQGGPVGALARGRPGELWIGGSKGIGRLKDQSLDFFKREGGALAQPYSQVAVSANGHVWAGSANLREVARFDGETLTNLPSRALKLDHFDQMATRSNGEVWFGGGGGVSRYDGQEIRKFGTNDGMFDSHVTHVYAGPEGSVWLHGQSGLTRYDGRSFETFSQSNSPVGSMFGLSSVFVETNGNAWIGMPAGLLRFDARTRQLSPVLSPKGSRGALFGVGTAYQDADRVLWFGTREGVIRYDGTVWSTLDARDWPSAETKGGVAGNEVSRILPGKDGAVWLQTDAGLIRYRRNRRLPAPPRVHFDVSRAEVSWKAILQRSRDMGVRVSFQAEETDFRSRPENRFYRFKPIAGSVPLAELGKAEGWSAPQQEGRFDWKPTRAGPYTVAFQYIDRDLNYSPLARLELEIAPLWFLNAWITVPSGAALLGVLGWTAVARSLYRRKRREAERLREQMLEQEQRARVKLEQEVAERRRVEESLSAAKGLYHSVVDNIPQFVFRKDLEGHFTFAQSGRTFIGHPAAEFIGKDDHIWAPPDLCERIRQHDREVIESGQTREATSEIRLPGGSSLFFHTVRTPIREADGRITGVQIIAWDVTEQRLAELALEEARKAADQANQAKSQFLANMSHELRTPLNAIIGYSEMLQEAVQDLGQKELQPDLEKIHTAGRHLLGLINDILDLSKIEAGKMTLYLEEFSVADMMREVATTVQPLVAKNGNQLKLEIIPEVGVMRADLTKVRQTLFNLLSNACKFTEHGLITLGVKGEDVTPEQVPSGSHGSRLTFYVSDTGIGLNEDQVTRLFEAFSQADASTTRRFGGTGLGLAISRRFCRLMGGDLTVSSTPGKGSTFTVILPARVEDPALTALGEAGPAAISHQPASPRPRSTILVIDDEANARDLIERALSKDGFGVELAGDGKTGLELARKHKPDVITLDVMMPGMDGWAVLAALKADPETAPIPVIMLTIVDDKQIGFALGAADYFTKPIDWARLHQTLSKYRKDSEAATVLIVEDEAPTREILRRTLAKDGWLVEEAENGRVALTKLEARLPVVILLDLMMPEMDGFEFMSALRQRPEYRHVPVIVITAKDLTEEDRRRLNGQVARILKKSAMTRDELVAEVRSLAGRSFK